MSFCILRSISSTVSNFLLIGMIVGLPRIERILWVLRSKNLCSSFWNILKVEPSEMCCAIMPDNWLTFLEFVRLWIIPSFLRAKLSILPQIWVEYLFVDVLSPSHNTVFFKLSLLQSFSMTALQLVEFFVYSSLSLCFIISLNLVIMISSFLVLSSVWLSSVRMSSLNIPMMYRLKVSDVKR